MRGYKPRLPGRLLARLQTAPTGAAVGAGAEVDAENTSNYTLRKFRNNAFPANVRIDSG